MTVRKILLPLSMLVFLSACDNNNRLSLEPPVQTATDRILAVASQPDDVGEPFPVNDGAFAFDDTAEDSEPVTVNR